MLNVVISIKNRLMWLLKLTYDQRVQEQFFLSEYMINNTTYIRRFLLQNCQVYFSNFTKQISTDMFCCTGVI